MTIETLERHMEAVYRNLYRDLGETVPAEQVRTVARAHYESVSREARINDFVPLLVYRFAKAELVTSRRDELHNAA